MDESGESGGGGGGGSCSEGPETVVVTTTTTTSGVGTVTKNHNLDNILKLESSLGCSEENFRCNGVVVGTSHISDDEYHHNSLTDNKTSSTTNTSATTTTTKRSIGVLTDTQDLGECAEPGSSILLESIIWNETNKGVLILNVKWRGKTFVGSLIDTAKSS
jgi:hypothetical protein